MKWVNRAFKLVMILWALGGLGLILLAFGQSLGTGVVVGAPVACIWGIGLIAFGVGVVLTRPHG